VLALGSAMIARMDMRALARPLMQDVADRSGAMVALGLRDRLNMIYVEACRSEAALTLSLNVGSRLPRGHHRHGPGLPGGQHRRRAAPSCWSASARRTKRPGPACSARMDESLSEYQALGCCSSFGEWQREVNAVAVAFRSARGARRDVHQLRRAGLQPVARAT
jgi:DNA-binding IclR family transcriptional regulator